MKELLKKIVLRPKWVKYCSQTLYEALSFCNNMYNITNNQDWKKEGSHIIEKIRRIQQDDGGFDIGYEFNFGKTHKKGWSSSPECKMLVSLIEFGSIFCFREVTDIVDKGIQWILTNSIPIDEDKWTIPYCPMATKEVMVYNGVSFALAPLAMYYKHIKQDKKIKEIHDGYINYLYDEFEWENGYWKYSDQKRTDLNDIHRIKIDNYHLGQQLEMHCRSYDSLPYRKNKEIIDSLAEYLMTLHHESYPNPLPYLNYISNQEHGVHLWGYASLINGFLCYYHISKKKEFLVASKQIFEWINKFAWLNTHFACVYHEDPKRMDKRFYPRSDAWVINNLSSYLRCRCEREYMTRLQNVYENIRTQDYSGFENHAATNVNKIVTRIWTNLIQIKTRSSKGHTK
jgi:hypothetical protein